MLMSAGYVRDERENYNNGIRGMERQNCYGRFKYSRRITKIRRQLSLLSITSEVADEENK